MRSLPVVVPAFLLFADAAAIADPSNAVSWGKAGVSLREFARDATECSETSRTAAVSIAPETLRNLDALSSVALLDVAMQAGGAPDGDPIKFASDIASQKSPDDIARRTNTFGGRYVAMVRRNVEDELQDVLNKCLVERGYSRIILTPDQRKGLSKFKRNSAARTAYLHSIDSDPFVLERQRLGNEDSSGLPSGR